MIKIRLALFIALLFTLSTALAACKKEASTPPTTTTTAANSSWSNTWLMFYCTNPSLGPVDIYINNYYRGTVTNWYNYRPGCGAAGCVTVQLFGPFTWYAVRRADGYIYSTNIMTYPGCNSFFFY